MSAKININERFFLPIIAFLMIGFVILDQVVKNLFLQRFSYSLLYFGDFFRLEFYQNYGIAFGIPFKTEFFYAIFFLFFAWLASGKLLNFKEMGKKEVLAVGLIISGALGNLIDRIRFGYIIDFINFKDLIIFNLADVFIAAGVIIMLEKFLPDIVNKKLKKSIYILLFTAFGALVSFLIHAGIEIWYIDLLLLDFSKYSFGLSWTNWYLIHGIGTVVLFVGGVLFGYLQGRYWWKALHEKR